MGAAGRAPLIVSDLVTKQLEEDNERVWELPRRNHQEHAVQVPRVRELGFRNWGREPAEVSKLTRRDPVSKPQLLFVYNTFDRIRSTKGDFN